MANPGTTRPSILNRAKGGDKTAAAELAAIYWPWLHDVLIREFRQRPEDVEDAVQTAFLRALPKLSAFEHLGRGSFRMWLRRIGVNAILAELRANWVRRRAGNAEATLQELPEIRPDALLNYFDSEEVGIRMKWAEDRACEVFTPQEIEAWRLHYREGRTRKEVAAHLRITAVEAQTFCTRVMRHVQDEAKLVLGDD